MPKSKPLDKVQTTYIEAQMYKVSPEEIAADLKLPVARVRSKVASLKRAHALVAPEVPPEGAGDAARRPEAAPPRQSPLDGMKLLGAESGQWNGAVQMTPQQSMADDAALNASPFASVPGLTEAQKSYIRDNMGHKKAAEIAGDTGLTPQQVQTVLDALNPAELGRQQFLDRNRNTIHKIRPDQPHR